MDHHLLVNAVLVVSPIILFSIATVFGSDIIEKFDNENKPVSKMSIAKMTEEERQFFYSLLEGRSAPLTYGELYEAQKLKDRRERKEKDKVLLEQQKHG
jgi:hypothetical protein